jgi:tRNA1(Val) A37 N6-methylase TrmN6
MRGGGFDVVIGNPPYLEVREVEYSLGAFASRDSNAIHAMCMERSCDLLLSKHGAISMIVPLALPSTQRMRVVQQIIERKRSAWFSNFAWRPAKLFDTVIER